MAFKFDENTYCLQILDQTLLPNEKRYVDVKSGLEGFNVIKNMLVRGAPCIAAVGCLSIVAEINQPEFSSNNETVEAAMESLETRAKTIISSRPTAVNLRRALNELIELAKRECLKDIDLGELIQFLTRTCLGALRRGIESNHSLAAHGYDAILTNSSHSKDGVSILTHCNTGSLATVDLGTALGVIKVLHRRHKLKRVYCTETRPYNQGSRLTAWEIVQDGLPGTLIADSMVAYLMATSRLDAVIVGADCVAANGDTANKIGTYQIALIANQFNVPFYVAAPTQSIDLSIVDMKGIEIEQRPANELRQLGTLTLAPKEIDVWNPCFDVTPAGLICGIITQLGVCKPHELNKFLNEKNIKELEFEY